MSLVNKNGKDLSRREILEIEEKILSLLEGHSLVRCEAILDEVKSTLGGYCFYQHPTTPLHQRISDT
jgi:hypothetical protein